jgi:hypothetical protein
MPASRPPTDDASAKPSSSAATGSGPASSARSSAAARTPADSVKSRPANVNTLTGRRRTPAAAARAPSVAPAGANRGPHTSHHDQATHERARRRYEGLRAKAAATSFAEEAAACRVKAEQLRAKYGL